MYKPGHLKWQRKYIKFYRGLIGRPDELLIFDIGANCGDFTDLYLRLGAKVISLEPDRTNYRILQARFKYNRKVSIVNKAVSDQAGTEKFYIEKEGSVFNTLSIKWISMVSDPKKNFWGYNVSYGLDYDVETTTLDNLIAEFGMPHFIKIDVEGYELRVIRSLSYQVPFLSFEVHLPEFMEETLCCLRHLSSISDASKFNYDAGNGLVLESYSNRDQFIALLENSPPRVAEIYCKNQSVRSSQV